MAVNAPPPAAPSAAAESSAAAGADDALLAGFPRAFAGPLIFAPQDNLNTDGIYPGKYTYQDDITPDRQAEVVMENYDASFASTVASLRSTLSDPPAGGRAGVVLLGGYNFGTGSSREQAATALKHAGVPLVLAGSFGDIFKRNAINNGLVCLECPQLVEDLTAEVARGGARGSGGSKEGEISVLLDGGSANIQVDSATGRLRLERADGSIKEYVTRPAGIGKSVQDIYTKGGLEEWVKARLASQAAA